MEKPYKNTESEKVFVSEIQTLVNNKDSFPDIEIVCCGKVHYAHKGILAARNSFFKENIKPETKKINLDDLLKSKTVDGMFEIILKYIYTGDLHINYENCLDIYELANAFNLGSAVNLSSKYISDTVDSQLVCGILATALKRDVPKIIQQCTDSLERNTESAIRSDSFVDLPKDFIINLLKNEKLNCSEKALFDAIIRWWGANKDEIIEGDKKTQDKFLFDNFLYWIRYPLMDPEGILEIEKMNFIPEELIVEAYRYHACQQDDAISTKTETNYEDGSFRRRQRGGIVSSFYWDSQHKGSNLVLQNSNKTITITQPNICTYQMVLGNSGYASGIHIWEITIDSCVSSSHIMIGVTNGKQNLTQWVGQDMNGWSWFGFNGTKYHKGSSPTYANGEKFGINDVIGVKLNVNIGSLFFYKNGKALGVAFNNLKSTSPNSMFYPAVSLRQTGEKVTLSTVNLKYEQVYAKLRSSKTT